MKPKHLFAAGLIALTSSFAMADDCAVTVTGNDSMQFDTKAITVGKACKKFTVTLKHSGKLAKNVMGHNWVLSKTEDAQPIATDGASAGIDKDYLKPSDARIIAHTKLVGGGESDTIDLPLDKIPKGGNYTFFCSFPGHIAMMKGTLTRE